jgi:hypothetical protein
MRQHGRSDFVNIRSKIHDARPMIRQLSLDRQGFVLVLARVLETRFPGKRAVFNRDDGI